MQKAEVKYVQPVKLGQDVHFITIRQHMQIWRLVSIVKIPTMQRELKVKRKRNNGTIKTMGQTRLGKNRN